MTPREQLADVLHEKLLAASFAVTGGDLDGAQVVKVSDLGLIFMRSNWPELSVHGADVRTPARLLVEAVCPACEQVAAVVVNVDAQLTVTNAGGALKAAATTKASAHLCGQTTLELDEGQVTLADLIGNVERARDEATDAAEDPAEATDAEATDA